MSRTVTRLLDEFESGLQTIYKKRLRGVYLYGSYARGEQVRGSDVDVLVVLDRLGRYGTQIDRTGPLCSRLSLKYDVSISRVFISERDWEERQTPFLENLREEAIAT